MENTKIIYGTELAQRLREEMKQEIAKIVEAGKRVPCLAVVIAGEDPASLSYVKGKEKACQAIGMKSVMRQLRYDVTQECLEQEILALSNDPTVDGILLQLPLPKGLDENRAIACISPDKDVDGLTPINFGRMFLGEDSFRPCTPSGVMAILEAMDCNPEGKHAVVVGRSKLVGTPVARLLQDANATVTICHSYTRDLKKFTKEADILIAAVGKAHLFDSSYIKEGAYVVDVGVNRMEDGKLTGDVDFADVKDHCAAITPVPKGVGPMTITMLLQNTLKAYRRAEND